MTTPANYNGLPLWGHWPQMGVMVCWRSQSLKVFQAIVLTKRTQEGHQCSGIFISEHIYYMLKTTLCWSVALQIHGKTNWCSQSVGSWKYLKKKSKTIFLTQEILSPSVSKKKYEVTVFSLGQCLIMQWTAFKLVLEGYCRCPDSHDPSECHHLYD